MSTEQGTKGQVSREKKERFDLQPLAAAAGEKYPQRSSEKTI